MKRTQSSRYITRIAYYRLAALLFIVLLSVSSGVMLHANAMDRNAAKALQAYESGTESKKYKKLCVESGDTLWSIAKRYGDPDQDIRQYISRIKEINRLESSGLQTGQILLLP